MAQYKEAGLGRSAFILLDDSEYILYKLYAELQGLNASLSN